MVVRIRVDTTGMEALRVALKRSARPAIKKAMQESVIKTAYKAKEIAVARMPQVFYLPTRFTLNALRVKINRSSMSASVEPKDGYWSRAENYLGVQIEGGARRQKAFERALSSMGILPAGWVAVPGQGARIDAAGNMSVGQIKQILSWFGAAEPTAGSTQNMTEEGRKKLRRGTRKRAGFEYFAVIPGRLRGNGARQKLLPGIYKRTFLGFGGAIIPVLIFVRAATYKPVYPLEQIGQEAVRDHFKPIFNQVFPKYWAAGLPKYINFGPVRVWTRD